MRTILNGVLSIELLHVPVGIATAAQRKKLEFRTLHDVEGCGVPIKQHKFCEKCQREVTNEELVKGFEFAKKQYVRIPEGDLQALAAERSPVLGITKFVKMEQVNDLQVDRSYYLTPPEMMPGPYCLLWQVLMTENKAALGSCVLWGLESPMLVWPKDTGSLVLSMLFCHDEVVDDSDVGVITHSTAVTSSGLEMASTLIQALTADIVPEEDLVSQSRIRLDDYVAMKVGGGADFQFGQPPALPEISHDLMGAIRESVAAVEERQQADEPIPF